MFSEVISALKAAKKIAIFAHIHPDGDALGSSYSLKLALLNAGKQVEVFPCSGADTPAFELVRRGEATGLTPDECDLLIAVDCADIARLGEYAEIFAAAPNSAAIDHHITHKAFSKIPPVVVDISSTCELMYSLYRGAGLEITGDIAHNLYIGIVSDTGNFKYESVTADTHRIAAALIDKGINFSEISKRLFDTKSIEYLRLMQTALNKLKLFSGGKIAVLHLNQFDFDTADIDESRAVGIVTIPISVEGVEVGVYIRDRGNGEYKVSLRSNRYVDVAGIAAHFGGGGHVRASGYTVKGTNIDNAVADIIKETEKML